jgi:uncharacterized phage protein gp47/JayE
MPFERPLLDALRARIADDLINKLPGADARLRVSNLRAFSEVEAGTTHLLYGRLDWSFRQLFPDTAETEFLDRWASIWGVQRYPATAAAGRVVWPAQANAQVPAGALMQRGDGVRYHADMGGSEHDGEIVLFVQADEPGRDGNAEPGAVLRLSTTAAGVAVEGTVEYPGLAGGADQQSDALLLQAVLLRIRQPPHGGAAFDYVRWTLEVPGVTRAWCYPLQNGAGSVTVRFMMDEVRANNPAGAGIPTEADVVLVAAHIDPVRPVTARILVYPPIAYPVDVTIAGLEPDTPEIRDMIAEGLAQMLLQETEPGGSIYLSQWSAAIAFTPGVRRFVLVAPAAQVDVEVGEIVALGEVHYQ